MKINECRSCGCTNLKPIISLGNHYVSGFVDSEEEKVPLSLVLKDKEKDFLKEGGKFVLPLPKFRIVSDDSL